MAEKHGKLQEVRLTTPVSAEAIAGLKLGQVVYLDGVVYTGREGVYRRILDEGVAPPVDLAGLSNVNFHCSPAAAVAEDGSTNVGAVTATASFRFSKWMARWFEVSGARVILGKGGMPEKDYREVFVPAGAVYLTTVGYGTGALLGRGIRHVRAVHWLEELGIAQALWVFEVENFGPFLVESDAKGNSLFERNNRAMAARSDAFYQGLKPPALHRYGETDDRKDELI
ncbi:MAG: fumarate hydratase C-terminal domain-containing protein [Proteobacteria bacterium]|nr:fumarate hydratase C-terminal domain-containing protein [Pseudomonadota bacterium]